MFLNSKMAKVEDVLESGSQSVSMRNEGERGMIYDMFRLRPNTRLISTAVSPRL